MAADTDGWSVLELRQMDRDEARQTLPVAEFERWEQLHELEQGADETRERWAEEDREVQALAVNADPERLGTAVDLFGNDVLVHVESDDPAFTDAVESLQDLLGDDVDDPKAEIETLQENRAETVECFIDILDAVILRWQGTDWDDVDPATRHETLRQAADKWGLDAMFVAVMRIFSAVSEDRHPLRQRLAGFLQLGLAHGLGVLAFGANRLQFVA